MFPDSRLSVSGSASGQYFVQLISAWWGLWEVGMYPRLPRRHPTGLILFSLPIYRRQLKKQTRRAAGDGQFTEYYHVWRILDPET